MAVVLKHRDQDTYLASYNGVTGEVKFTKKASEAKGYSNDWFAKAELEYLQFHFPEVDDIKMKEMIVYFT